MTMFPKTSLTHSIVDLAHFKLTDLWLSTYSEKTSECTETSSAILQDGDAHAEGALAAAVPVFERPLCGQNEKTKSAWCTLWLIGKGRNAC